MKRAALAALPALAVPASALAASAIAASAIGASALAQGRTPIDLRLVAGGGVLARPGERAGEGAGVSVRVVGNGWTCDATTQARADTPIVDAVGVVQTGLVAAVGPCPSDEPLFAVLGHHPRWPWPRAVDATAERLAAGLALAQEAAARAGHYRGAIEWDVPRAYDEGSDAYVLVTGPRCDAELGCAVSVAALARVRGGQASVVIARPSHGSFGDDEASHCRARWEGVVDVEGDGVVELVETQRCDGAFLVRLVREGARAEGEVVWEARYVGSPIGASVDHPPRPPHPR